MDEVKRETYVEVVTASFWRELAAFFDEISELRLPSFEFSGLIVGRDPVGDLFFSLPPCQYFN